MQYLFDIENTKLNCGYKYIGDELSPKGMKKPVPDPFEREAFEKYQPMLGFPPYSELLDNDNRRSIGRKIDVVNQLDPEKNFLNEQRLIELINADDEGPNYLIIDNLFDGIFPDLSIEGLRGCRREAETLTNAVCSKEPELGKRALVNQSAKCDALIWLDDYLGHPEAAESNQN